MRSSAQIAFLAAVALFGFGCHGPQVRPAPVAVAPLVIAPVAPPEPRSEELFNQGVTAFRAQEFTAAAEAFERVLKKAPDNVHAQFNLGLCAERLGKTPQALSAYEAAHHLDPTHEPTLLNLGRLYQSEGRLDDAVALYESGLKRPGKEYELSLLNNLTVAYRLLKRYPEAEATARKVLSRAPSNAEAYKNLVLVFYDEGNYRMAELISSSAKRYDEKDPGVYNNLGMVYLKLEDVPRALAQFKKAVALDPHFAPGYRNLGAIALTYRDYAGAEKAFEALIHLAPEDTEALCGAGWAYAQNHDSWDKALPLLKRCGDAKGVSEDDRHAAELKIASIEQMKKVSPGADDEGKGGAGPGANPAQSETPRASEPASSDDPEDSEN